MQSDIPTAIRSLPELWRMQRGAFLASPAPGVAERKADIARVVSAVLARRDDIAHAIASDFGGRSHQETMLAEVIATVNAGRYAMRRLSGWMRRRRCSVQAALMPGRAWVQPQPRGVVGIVAPWNFPVNAALVPLISALAAGNRAMIKPSEYTPKTSSLLTAILHEQFPREQVAVVEGDDEVAREFVRLPWDFLFFTGSIAVGRQVMRAAAENLTPLILELGGKSPAILTPSADVGRAAADLVYGKIMNAGQICVSPDYAMVPFAQKSNFIESFERAVLQHLKPENSSSPTNVAGDKHLRRLQEYLAEAQSQVVEIIRPAAGDGRNMIPTLVVDPPENLRIAQEEIFGPILILRTYRDLADCVGFVNARDRPLALYIFGKDRGEIDMLLSRTCSGSVCINGVLNQVFVDDLPFGGVGSSGMGQYRGISGFNALSHLKPVFETRGRPLTTIFRFPDRPVARKLMRFLLQAEDWRSKWTRPPGPLR